MKNFSAQHLQERLHRHRQSLRYRFKKLPARLMVDDFPVSITPILSPIPAALPSTGPLSLTLLRKLHQVRGEFRKNAIIHQTVLVAVSGGIDSTVLTDVLFLLLPELELLPILLHFNHQLRGEESDQDAAFVQQLAATYGFPLITASAPVRDYVRQKRWNLEQGARQLRYACFAQLASLLNIRYLCTAHTKNDLAETVLLNFLRGSSVTGLAGIARLRSLSDQTLLFRPLLGWDRSDIHTFARARSLQWREDSSNRDLRYRRNRIRHQLLPLLAQQFNPNIIDTLARTAAHFADLDEYLDHFVASLQEKLVAEKSERTIALHLSALMAQPPFLQKELLARLIARFFGFTPQWHQLDRILSVTHKQTGTIETIQKNLVALRDRHLLILSTPPAAVSVQKTIEKTGCFTIDGKQLCLRELPRSRWRRSKKYHFVDSAKVPQRLILRTWKAGDLFQPLGMAAPMKLSDFLTNQKVSVLERPTVCVLTTPDNEIIYVCGYQISERFKIDDNTRRVLRLEWKSMGPNKEAKRE